MLHQDVSTHCFHLDCLDQQRLRTPTFASRTPDCQHTPWISARDRDCLRRRERASLFWIPKATLAAIIIYAVWPIIGSPMTYYQYWRTSLVDFNTSMISFWLSLFTSSEVGIGSAVLFNIAHIILRQVFTRPTQFGFGALELAASPGSFEATLSDIPPDARVFQSNESLYFSNANRVKTSVLDGMPTFHSGALNESINDADRSWSVVGEKRVAKIRRMANIVDAPPSIYVLVLDFSRVNLIDTTALSALRNLCAEVRKYTGASVKTRFSALADNVRERFVRGGSDLRDGDGLSDTVGPTTVEVFRSVTEAVMAPHQEFKVVIPKNENSGH